MFLSCDHYFSVIIILLQYLTETWYYLVLVRKNKSLPIWLLYFETKYVFKTDGGQQPRMIHPPHIRLLWWKALWQPQVPPKVRIFWWRAIDNYFPIKAELKGWHIEGEFRPCLWSSGGRSIYHIAVQCPPAKQLILEGGKYNHRM